MRINISAPKCAYWNTSSNNWSFEGCDLMEHNANYTRCLCNHLTNFAVIMDVNGNLDDMDGVSNPNIHNSRNCNSTKTYIDYRRF